MIFNYIEINDVFPSDPGKILQLGDKAGNVDFSVSISVGKWPHPFISVDTVFCQMSIFPPALPL